MFTKITKPLGFVGSLGLVIAGLTLSSPSCMAEGEQCVCAAFSEYNPHHAILSCHPFAFNEPKTEKDCETRCKGILSTYPLKRPYFWSHKAEEECGHYIKCTRHSKGAIEKSAE